PVVLHAAILGSCRVNRAVALIAANDCGRGDFIVVTAVPTTYFVIAGELMIQFDVELPTRVGTNNDLAPVRVWVNGTRYVGMRIKIQNRLPDGIDLAGRDLVARKLVVRTSRRSLVSGARVVNSGI